MSAAWQTRPVFVSSTFLDMQAERDHLRWHVFPELEERLRARCAHLEWVDLRLGIVSAADAAEAAREAQVLKVCLDEVQRCRPFLLVLLGDRYGWVPPDERFADAAREAGLPAGRAPCSVTELEIESGALRLPTGAAPRCLVYLRAPLPLSQMPPDLAAQYADAPESPAFERMAALKHRLAQVLPGRVRHYTATWDTAQQRVTSLEDFGRSVLEDLWAQLAEHVPATPAPLSWADAERQALDDFAADRARDFVGRERVLAHLMRVATARDEPGRVAMGACLTGAPGAGKSALWCELRRQLGATQAVVLAHAAGASPAAGSVDGMLRRWVQELQATLGLPREDTAALAAPALQERFATLLAREAARRRVVLLLDGADQFDDGTRGRLHTWLPRPWPANARLIATAAPGASAQALAQHPGLQFTVLPPLDAGEARHIAKAISARYHRTLEPEVVAALLAVPGQQGPASGNALWLVNATEELNLLDADALQRATRSASGTPAERLRAMLLDEVQALPGDLAGLYRLGFAQAQAVYGSDFTQAFLGLIALSRGGWREQDLRVLAPRLTGQPWDGLRFAALRRHFRGQMRQRTGPAQWDFHHAQMRQAALVLLDASGVDAEAWHAAIAEHLLALNAQDPLRVGQAMHHLLASGHAARAAAHYADPALSDEALDAATQALEGSIHGNQPDDAPDAAGGAAALATVAGLLQAGAADPALQLRLARRLLFHLGDHLQGRASVPVQLALVDLVQPIVDRAAQRTPAADVLRDLAVCGLRRGGLLKDAGYLLAAAEALREALAVLEPLPDARPDMLAQAWRDLGDLLFLAGQHDAALQALQTAVAQDERALSLEPQQGEHQASLARSHEHRGRVLMNTGQREAAREAYARSCQILQALLARQPAPVAWRDALARGLEGLSEALAAGGHHAQALQACTQALAVTESLAADQPELAWLQLSLALSHERLGDLQFSAGQGAAAQASYERSLAIRERLAAADPAHATLQRHLANSLERLAGCCERQGDDERAQTLQARALAILQPLVEADPRNLDWRLGLASLLMHQGERLAARELPAAALPLFQQAMEHCAALAVAMPGETRVQRLQSACELQTGDAHADLGHPDAALASYRRAQALRQRLADADPGNASAQDDLAAAHNRIGRVLADGGQLDEALAAYRRALALSTPLAEAEPGHLMRRFNLGILHKCIGDALRSSDPLHALQAYRSQADIEDALIDAGPGPWPRLALRCHEALRDFVRAEPRLGDAGHWALADSLIRIAELQAAQGSIGAAKRSYDEALAALPVGCSSEDRFLQAQLRAQAGLADLHLADGEVDEALALRQAQVNGAEALAALAPGDPDTLRQLSWAYNQLASLLDRQGQPERALDVWRSDLALDRRQVAAAPGDAQRAWDLSISLNRVGDSLLNLSQPDEALALYRESLALRERLCQPQPAPGEWRRGRVVGINRVAQALVVLGQLQQALTENDQALQTATGMAAEAPDNSEWQKGLAECQLRRAGMLRALGRVDEAQAAQQQAQAILEALPDAPQPAA